MDTLFKRVQHRRVGSAASGILWKNLNGDATEAFRSRVSEGVSTQIEAISASDVDSMWNTLASIIKDGVKDSLGVAIGTSNIHTNQERSRAQEMYKLAKREAKKVVAQEKGSRGQCFIKDEKGRTITDEEEIKKRWGEYFSSLFNLREPEGHEEVVDPNILPFFDCYYSRISQSEVKTVLQKIGELRQCSSIEAIHLIKSLMEKFKERQKDLYLAFIDLEKACDSVPRDLIWKILIDKRASRRYIKVIRDMVAIRPAMLYGSECWPITKALANRMKVAELRMLRWTCGKTMLDMIPDGVCRAELEVEFIINKMGEGRLRWFGHVRRRSYSAPVRRVEALVVDSLRRKGRPKLRWEDRVKHDMKELLLSVDMTSDRNDSDRLERWARSRFRRLDGWCSGFGLGAYAVNGNLTPCVDVLKRMADEGLKADARTYDALVLGACKAGKMGGAIVIMRKLVEGGIEPIYATYAHVIGGMVKLGYYAQAVKFVMSYEGKDKKLDSHNFGLLAVRLVVKKQMDEAKNVLEEMVKRDLVMDETVKKIYDQIVGTGNKI
nr:hypothetical protein [Tanacetum cinerariifolium]